MSRAAIPVICAAAAFAGACATDPPRDSGRDARSAVEMAATQPGMPRAPGEAVTESEVRTWLADLDSADERVFSQALTRLRWAASAAEDAVARPEWLPKSLHGLQAFFGLVTSRPPRDETHAIQLRSSLATFAVTPRFLHGGGEQPESVEFRLATAAWLAALDSPQDAKTFGQLLADGTRALRWAAGGYFRARPTRLSVADLEAAVKRLDSSETEVRADAAAFLSAFEQILAPAAAGVLRHRVAFDPYADAPVRERQALKWRDWLKEAGPRLLRLSATAE